MQVRLPIDRLLGGRHPQPPEKTRQSVATHPGLLSVLVVLVLSSVFPAPAKDDTVNVFDLSLDELLQLEVTSVSKRAEPLVGAPAAVVVLTAEDIRRSGARRLPDLLRLVPGVQVAQTSTKRWAVSIRGFNDLFANKLLVLIDGRRVYDASFSGVIWEVQDVVLEDVERIEVIRGPGAALWGSNAVNGVINIITKHADDTAGTLVTAAVDNPAGWEGTLRHGHTSDRSSFRTYAKYTERDAYDLEQGGSAEDDWFSLQGGFRLDSELQHRGTLTLQGDIYRFTMNDTLTIPVFSPPYAVPTPYEEIARGGNLLARWVDERPSGRFEVQGYYDYHENEREQFSSQDSGETIGISLQHDWAASERTKLLWGAEYLLFSDSIDSFEFVEFEPHDDAFHTLAAFAQAELGLDSRGRWWCTIGTRVEDSDFFGTSLQPTARLRWELSPSRFLWVSYSIAERTPNRADRDNEALVAVIDEALQLVARRNPDIASERLKAIDVGYRGQLGAGTFFDLATFYYQYDDLVVMRIADIDGTTKPATLPILLSNQGAARSWGTELAIDLRPWEHWRLRTNISALDLELETPEGALPRPEVSHPELAANLWLSYTPSSAVELDLFVRYVDELSTMGIDAYTALDARLAWAPLPAVTLSLVGRNLTDSDHLEFDTGFIGPGPTLVPRTISAKLEWRF